MTASRTIDFIIKMRDFPPVTNDKDVLSPTGYVITGLLMLAVAGLCLTPDSFSLHSMNAFRLYGGTVLVAIGLLIAYLYGGKLSAVLMIVNGLMFVLAAEVSLTSTQDFAMIIFVAGYVILAALCLLMNDRSYILALAMLSTGLNVVCRYLMGAASDGTAVASGVFCLIATVLFLYVGVASLSDRMKLPVI